MGFTPVNGLDACHDLSSREGQHSFKSGLIEKENGEKWTITRMNDQINDGLEHTLVMYKEQNAMLSGTIQEAKKTAREAIQPMLNVDTSIKKSKQL